MPGFSSGKKINRARSMTLKTVKRFSSGSITDQILADIDADLAKLPVKM